MARKSSAIRSTSEGIARALDSVKTKTTNGSVVNVSGQNKQNKMNYAAALKQFNSTGKQSKPKPPKGPGGWKGVLQDVMESPVGKGLMLLDMPRAYLTSHVADVAQEVMQGDTGGALRAIGDTAIGNWENKQNRTAFWAHTGAGTYLQQGINAAGLDDTWVNNRALKIALGLTGDIVLDPVSWLSGGVAGSASEAGRTILSNAERLAIAAGDDAVRAAGSHLDEAALAVIRSDAELTSRKGTEALAAKVIRKGKSAMSREESLTHFPQASTFSHENATGLRLKIPGTGRVGKLVGYKGGEKSIPLLSKNLTDPITRTGAIFKQALPNSELARKVMSAIGGKVPGVREMIRSGDPELMKQGFTMQTANHLGNAFEAAGIRMPNDSTIEGAVTAVGTGYVKGKQADMVFRDLSRRLKMKGNDWNVARDAVEGAVDAAQFASVKGAPELKQFLGDLYRVLKDTGANVDELDNYFPRIVTDEARATYGLPRGSGGGAGRPTFTHGRTVINPEGVSNFTMRQFLDDIAKQDGLRSGFYENDAVRTIHSYIRGLSRVGGQQKALQHLVENGVVLNGEQMWAVTSSIKKLNPIAKRIDKRAAEWAAEGVDAITEIRKAHAQVQAAIDHLMAAENLSYDDALNKVLVDLEDLANSAPPPMAGGPDPMRPPPQGGGPAGPTTPPRPTQPTGPVPDPTAPPSGSGSTGPTNPTRPPTSPTTPPVDPSGPIPASVVPDPTVAPPSVPYVKQTREEALSQSRSEGLALAAKRREDLKHGVAYTHTGEGLKDSYQNRGAIRAFVAQEFGMQEANKIVDDLFVYGAGSEAQQIFNLSTNKSMRFGKSLQGGWTDTLKARIERIMERVRLQGEYAGASSDYLDRYIPVNNFVSDEFSKGWINKATRDARIKDYPTSLRDKAKWILKGDTNGSKHAILDETVEKLNQLHYDFYGDGPTLRNAAETVTNKIETDVADILAQQNKNVQAEDSVTVANDIIGDRPQPDGHYLLEGANGTKPVDIHDFEIQNDAFQYIDSRQEQELRKMMVDVTEWYNMEPAERDALNRKIVRRYNDMLMEMDAADAANAAPEVNVVPEPSVVDNAAPSASAFNPEDVATRPLNNNQTSVTRDGVPIGQVSRTGERKFAAAAVRDPSENSSSLKDLGTFKTRKEAIEAIAYHHDEYYFGRIRDAWINDTTGTIPTPKVTPSQGVARLVVEPSGNKNLYKLVQYADGATEGTIVQDGLTLDKALAQADSGLGRPTAISTGKKFPGAKKDTWELKEITPGKFVAGKNDEWTLVADGGYLVKEIKPYSGDEIIGAVKPGNTLWVRKTGKPPADVETKPSYTLLGSKKTGSKGKTITYKGAEYSSVSTGVSFEEAQKTIQDIVGSSAKRAWETANPPATRAAASSPGYVLGDAQGMDNLARETTTVMPGDRVGTVERRMEGGGGGGGNVSGEGGSAVGGSGGLDPSVVAAQRAELEANLATLQERNTAMMEMWLANTSSKEAGAAVMQAGNELAAAERELYLFNIKFKVDTPPITDAVAPFAVPSFDNTLSLDISVPQGSFNIPKHGIEVIETPGTFKEISGGPGHTVTVVDQPQVYEIKVNGVTVKSNRMWADAVHDVNNIIESSAPTPPVSSVVTPSEPIAAGAGAGTPPPSGGGGAGAGTPPPSGGGGAGAGTPPPPPGGATPPPPRGRGGLGKPAPGAEWQGQAIPTAKYPRPAEAAQTKAMVKDIVNITKGHTAATIMAQDIASVTAVQASSSAANIRRVLTAEPPVLLQALQDEVARIRQVIKSTPKGVAKPTSQIEEIIQGGIDALVSREKLIALARKQSDKAIQASMIHEAEARLAEVYLEIAKIGKTQRAVRQVTNEANAKLTPEIEEFAQRVNSGAWQELSSNPGFYGPRDVADMWKQMYTVTTPQGMKGFFSYYDKYVTWLKKWQIATPGFHIRNYLGGVFNNYLAGVDIGAVGKFYRTHRAWEKGLLGEAEGKRFSGLMDFLGGGGQYSRDEIGGGVGHSWKPWATNFVPIELSAAGGHKVEFYLRGALGWDRILKGNTVEMAIDDIAKFHFDYSDLSQMERKIKRVVPFYTWTRYNVPLQLEMLLENPGKYTKYQIIKDNIEQHSKEKGVVPAFLKQDMFGVRLPFNFGGGQAYATPDLPFTQTISNALPDFKNFDPGKSKSYSSLSNNWLSMMTPVIKTPAELFKNEQFFKGIPMPKDYRGQKMPLGMNNPAGRAAGSFFGGNNKTAYLLEQLVPAYGRGRRLFPSEEKYKNRRPAAIASFFGVPIRGVTKDDQRNEYLRRYFAGLNLKTGERRR